MVYYCFLAVLPWPLDMVVKQEHGILKQGRQVVNNILSNLLHLNAILCTEL